MKMSNKPESISTNSICLHCFIRSIPSCTSLRVSIVLRCRISEYLQLSLRVQSSGKQLTGYSSLLLRVMFLWEKCVLFHLDQDSEIDTWREMLAWQVSWNWFRFLIFSVGIHGWAEPCSSASSTLPLGGRSLRVSVVPLLLWTGWLLRKGFELGYLRFAPSSS